MDNTMMKTVNSKMTAGVVRRTLVQAGAGRSRCEIRGGLGAEGEQTLAEDVKKGEKERANHEDMWRDGVFAGKRCGVSDKPSASSGQGVKSLEYRYEM
jgi:hypothetical protein